jgi:hypothetical protein
MVPDLRSHGGSPVPHLTARRSAMAESTVSVTQAGISDFNSISAQNHTPATLSCQANYLLDLNRRPRVALRLVWQFR